MIYAAYGMNLCADYMYDSLDMGGATLYGWRYGFRHYADVQPEAGAATPVGLWSITDDTFALLDRRESYPKFYDRSEVEVVMHDTAGTRVKAWVYHMARPGPLSPPSDGYLSLVIDGYTRLNLNETILRDALIACGYAGYDRRDVAS